MSKDVIELAQEIKQLAIDMKYDRYDFVWLQTQIKDDWGQVSIPAKYFSALSNYHQIIRLCEAIEKLAEYENMEPIAIYNLADGEIYKSINDIGDGKSVFAVNLYPHPNKQ
ncbi:hypothetical protein [Xenorhabdus bovienii]|uniref:hypothetical protein n=1 Tax=Xenorhabdus bovienii TaxID=40576 RepID=UPI003DA2EE2A